MGYINSRNISVFPVVNRNESKSGDIYARHSSEEMLAGIVNRLIDQTGFVITSEAEFKAAALAGGDIPFAFNIHGYYFKTTLADIISAAGSVTEGSTIYAVISVAKHGVWTELSGSDQPIDTSDPDDSDYQYEGISFITSEPQNPDENTFYIPLVIKSNSLSWGGTGYYIPTDSYIKFTGKSFIVERIDGTEIN